MIGTVVNPTNIRSGPFLTIKDAQTTSNVCYTLRIDENTFASTYIFKKLNYMFYF